MLASVKIRFIAFLCVCAGFCASAQEVAADYTVQNGVATVNVQSLGNAKALVALQAALDNDKVYKVIITETITLTAGTYLSATDLTTPPLGSSSRRKIVQVVEPFLPENGAVELEASKTGGELDTIVTPAPNYSTYNLFDINGSNVTISNITLMGGFKGPRSLASASDSALATTGGINNNSNLVMYDVDITRTGTALLNQPGATAVLVDCNIVRNANWYGGGILNFADYNSSAPEGSKYSNGGTLIMDRCSLTENESLGPSHGGGAAENQGLMCLNNCIVANNASTEIGGGINNCKGGDLYVMNSTFTGNITTSQKYGVTAGGAIGNAGGAGNVYIVNSILANNGYDTGDYVNKGSLGRYEGSTTDMFCHLANTAIDAVAGMERIDATNITVQIDGLFSGYRNDGVVAAGGNKDENGVNMSSGFEHAQVTPIPSSEIYSFAPAMVSVETNHFLFGLAVDTYFDYSAVLIGGKVSMGYKNGDKIVALGGDVQVPTEEMLVKVTFDGESRLVDEYGYPHNAIGASSVDPIIDLVKPPEPGMCLVKLGSFTGGKVSGVTVYGDSYISNSIVTVHAVANSAHYLNGWMINGEVMPDTAQQYIYSFPVSYQVTTITPIFLPVQTQIYRVRQRYPWNNLVDIDYSVAETNAVKYRLVFLATYEENGVTNTIQLKTFRKNANVHETQRLGDREDLHRSGDHRVTWDSAADGVKLKGKKLFFRAVACEGEER